MAKCSSNTASQYNDVGHLYASFAYDAVWAIALALDASIANGIRVEQFTYDNHSMADQLTNALEEVEFDGVSVSSLSSVVVASYRLSLSLLLGLCQVYQWGENWAHSDISV